MGRERQKKKNRSSIPKVKSKLRGRTKAGKKKVNFLGNELIAQKWLVGPFYLGWLETDSQKGTII